jgi:N-acetylglutamate synthase-like GNAT family acetyltransferase
MAQRSDTIVYRVATFDDETDILDVLEEVAPEIPVLLDTQDKKDKICTIIIQCCRMSGKSWVAVSDDGKVVGFALAQQYFQDEPIALPDIGVSAHARGRGIFATLMEKLKANGVRLTANVLHGNRSAMADRLAKIGFTIVRSDETETKLQWDPPPRQSPSGGSFDNR